MKYSAVILSLPSFPLKLFRESVQQLSTTSLGDRLNCNLNFITSLPTAHFNHTIILSHSFLKGQKSLQHQKLATKVLVLLPIIVKSTNLGITRVVFWGSNPCHQGNQKKWMEREVKSVPKVQIYWGKKLNFVESRSVKSAIWIGGVKSLKVLESKFKTPLLEQSDPTFSIHSLPPVTFHPKISFKKSRVYSLYMSTFLSTKTFCSPSCFHKPSHLHLHFSHFTIPEKSLGRAVFFPLVYPTVRRPKRHPWPHPPGHSPSFKVSKQQRGALSCWTP